MANFTHAQTIRITEALNKALKAQDEEFREKERELKNALVECEKKYEEEKAEGIAMRNSYREEKRKLERKLSGENKMKIDKIKKDIEKLKEEKERHKREKKVLKNFIKDYDTLKRYEDIYKKNIRDENQDEDELEEKAFLDEIVHPELRKPKVDDMTEEDIEALRDGNEEYDRMIKNENIDNVLKDIENIEKEDYLRYLNSKNLKYNKSTNRWWKPRRHLGRGGRKKKTKKRRKTRRKRRKTRRKKRKKRKKKTYKR